MRIAVCLVEGRSCYGLVGEAGLRLPGADFVQRFPDLPSVLGAGALPELEAAAGDVVAHGQFAYAAPVAPSAKVFAVGVNYMAHIREMGREPPDYPTLFTRHPDTLVGHGQPLVRPRVSEQFDFEGELAVVIGRPARYVKAARALDYVAGYTCLNDGSVRDFQRHTTQFTPGKNFPRSGACGPWIVTPDEVGDPSALRLETRLNGEVMQRAPTGDMRFKVPDIIEYCSTFANLLPGDIITTGTPGGVGAARKPPLWLRPGDRVTVEISRIGALSNPVIAEDPA